MGHLNGERWILSVCGVAVLFYCLLVLGFVGTSPDIGLRFLLADAESHEGIQIQQVVPALKYRGGVKPQVGDILLAIGPSEVEGQRLQPVGTFTHFTRVLLTLRGDVPYGGKLDPGADPSEHADRIPPLVEIGADQWMDRERWVEIEFRRPGQAETTKTWLQIHSVPFGEVLLTFTWFLLQLAIFSVGALSYWKRPYDRPARLFFTMCVVTLGAFVGGFHWWVIASSLWLNIPFAVSAIFVPAITLHFFLVYPHAKPPVAQYPRATLLALYLLPTLAAFGAVSLIGWSSWQYAHGQPNPAIWATLQALRHGVYSYLAIAAGYFVLTLVALVYSFFTTRNPIEHSQVKWILWAGLFSTGPVVYTLFLAQVHRVEFAAGAGRVPMFIASLLFMFAYAVGILRYKLMLVDQLFSREVLYFLSSLAATLVCSLMIALGSLIGIFQDLRSPWQAFVVAATLMVAAILLVWLRDSFQRMLDRRFFREKYQLDKALLRMNQTVGQMIDAAALGERMLSSCRDVLLVDRAAFYLRDAEKPLFRLVTAESDSRVPLQFPAASELLDLLALEPSLQRGGLAAGEGGPVVADLLRQLGADLVHALEVEDGVAGLVVLGPKRNGGTYTAEDLTFLAALGQATSVALHSAKVHQGVERLNQDLRLKLEKIAEQQRQIAMLQAEITGSQQMPPPREPEVFNRDQIKGNSPSIRVVLETVRKVSSSHSSVLIRGESGTGKELLAQTLHDNSPRRSGPMVRVHCAALASGLLESELFGHVKGAYTGAHRDKIGRFEMAHGGTLFLDEIGDISLETQIKLLRVLQERSFEPVGGTRTVQVDVRLIAATHQNLERLISEGKFREDLYYRLNVISIELPPLRERLDDIFELSLYLLNRAAPRVGKRITHLDEAAVEALRRHPWPGNIRQLENVIERAVVLAEQEVISVQDLPPEFRDLGQGPRYMLEAKPTPDRLPAGRSLDQRSQSGETPSIGERAQLLSALAQCQGNKARAARLLGMPRSTFFSKLKKFGIE